MKTAAILSFVSMIWCIAVLVKLGSCFSKKTPYTFSQWDGGLVLRGQTIGRVGTTVLTIFSLACGIAAAYVFAGTQALGHGL